MTQQSATGRHWALLPDVIDWFAEAVHPLVGWHTVSAVQGIRVGVSKPVDGGQEDHHRTE